MPLAAHLAKWSATAASCLETASDKEYHPAILRERGREHILEKEKRKKTRGPGRREEHHNASGTNVSSDKQYRVTTTHHKKNETAAAARSP